MVQGSQREDWLQFVENTTDPSLTYEDIFTFSNNSFSSVTGPGPYSPVYEMSPLPTRLLPVVGLPVNFDMFSLSGADDVARTVVQLDSLVVTGTLSSSIQLFHSVYGTNESKTGPGSIMVYPIHDVLEKGNISGFLVSLFYWQSLFEDVLADDQIGFICVLNNTCGDTFTWEVNGRNATWIGSGDLHDPRFEKHRLSKELPFYQNTSEAQQAGACGYSVFIYPNSNHRQSYDSRSPEIYTAVIALIFFGLSATFFLYDKFVQRRNDKVVGAAARSNKIVSSLFPAAVRDQLYAENEENEAAERKRNKWLHPKSGITDFLHGENEQADDMFMFETKPIAHLFPDCTIMCKYLQIKFTAWRKFQLNSVC